MLQFIQILIADLLVMYFFLYLIIEAKKKSAAGIKAIQIDSELYEEWQELKERLGVTHNDMIASSLIALKKMVLERKMAAQQKATQS